MNRSQIATKLILDEIKAFGKPQNIDSHVFIQRFFYLLKYYKINISYKFIWSYSLTSPFSFDLVEDILYIENLDVDDNWKISEEDKKRIHDLEQLILEQVNPDRYIKNLSNIVFLIKTFQASSQQSGNLKNVLIQIGHNITDCEIDRSVLTLKYLGILEQ